jgi:hypothetical protein
MKEYADLAALLPRIPTVDVILEDHASALNDDFIAYWDPQANPELLVEPFSARRMD